MHGTLKVNANMNASASGCEMADAITWPMSAATGPMPPTAVVSVPVPRNSPDSTPNADSLMAIAYRYAMNVCHPRPKKLVTGSIASPIAYRAVFCGLPSGL